MDWLVDLRQKHYVRPSYKTKVIIGTKLTMKLFYYMAQIKQTFPDNWDSSVLALLNEGLLLVPCTSLKLTHPARRMRLDQSRQQRSRPAPQWAPPQSHTSYIRRKIAQLNTGQVPAADELKWTNYREQHAIGTSSEDLQSTLHKVSW